MWDQLWGVASANKNMKNKRKSRPYPSGKSVKNIHEKYIEKFLRLYKNSKIVIVQRGAC